MNGRARLMLSFKTQRSLMTAREIAEKSRNGPSLRPLRLFSATSAVKGFFPPPRDLSLAGDDDPAPSCLSGITLMPTAGYSPVASPNAEAVESHRRSPPS